MSEVERVQYVLQTAGVEHAQLRRHYAEALLEAGLLKTPPNRLMLTAHWSKELREMLDDRLEDGTPVVQYVLLANPDLADRLRRLLSE